MISSAQQMLEQMGSLMNTQYDGQYVFAGGKTDTPRHGAALDLSGAGHRILFGDVQDPHINLASYLK